MGSYQWKENESKLSVFANGEIKKSVAKEEQRDGIVDFTNISDEENQNRTVKIKTSSKIEETEHVVVNNNRKKTVVILGDGATNTYNDKSKYIVINGREVDGLIITKGDVIVAGKVNFTGLILAKGNFGAVEDGCKKTFTEDIGNIDRILDKARISEEIFKIPGEIAVNVIPNENMQSNKPYKIKESIQKRLWKIIR